MEMVGMDITRFLVFGYKVEKCQHFFQHPNPGLFFDISVVILKN